MIGFYEHGLIFEARKKVWNQDSLNGDPGTKDTLVKCTAEFHEIFSNAVPICVCVCVGGTTYLILTTKATLDILCMWCCRRHVLRPRSLGTVTRWHQPQVTGRCALHGVGFVGDSLTKKKWPPFWQTSFSIAFFWLKVLEFRFKFRCNMFPGVHLTISKHWFCACSAPSHYQDQWWPSSLTHICGTRVEDEF